MASKKAEEADIERGKAPLFGDFRGYQPVASSPSFTPYDRMYHGPRNLHLTRPPTPLLVQYHPPLMSCHDEHDHGHGSGGHGHSHDVPLTSGPADSLYGQVDLVHVSALNAQGGGEAGQNVIKWADFRLASRRRT
jgi:hypothetical protein